MEKYSRNYLLSVQTQDGAFLTLKPPFSIEFDITRNALSSANTCTFKVFNLAENTRNKIRKNATDYSDIRRITFGAGYGENLSKAFDGFMSVAWSVRNRVDFITQMKAFDGGRAYANAVTDAQFPAGTDQKTIIDSIISSLPGVSKGVTGDYSGTITRGNSFSGSSTDILREISGGGFFIDNGKGHCLKDTECLKGAIEEITSASGLLGTPVVEKTIMHFDILFEPRLVIGQKIRVNSIADKRFNQDYKVISLQHRGMISESVCGSAITTVSVFAPQQLVTVG